MSRTYYIQTDYLQPVYVPAEDVVETSPAKKVGPGQWEIEMRGRFAEDEIAEIEAMAEENRRDGLPAPRFIRG